MEKPSKLCFRCDVNQPLSEFYAHSRMADGHLNKCKSCTRKDAAAWRAKNPERAREVSAGLRKTENYRNTRNAAVRAWKQREVNAYKSHNMVSKAIETGRLERRPCETCGAQETHAHHDDYDRPFDVRWLCVAHHREWHRVNGPGLNRKGSD